MPTDHRYELRAADSAPLGMCVLRKGLVAYANPRLAELLGAPPESLLNGFFEDFAHAEDRDAVRTLIGRISRSETDRASGEVRLVGRNGPPMRVRLFASPTRDEDLNLTVITVVDSNLCESITDRNQSAVRPAEWDDGVRPFSLISAGSVDKPVFHQARTLSVFDSLEAVVGVVDPSTREILFLNDFGGALYGGDSVGARCHRVFNNSAEPCDFCGLDAVLKGPGLVGRWSYTNTGTGRHFIATNKAVTWLDGRDAILQFHFDVTDHKETRLALEESEQRHGMLVETMNEGLAWEDASGRHVYVNQKFASMVGYTKSEIIGTTSLEYVAPECVDQVKEQTGRRREGVAGSYETSLLAKSGTRVPVIVSAAPLFDGDGVFSGDCAVFTDITERKRFEAELRRERRSMRTLSEQAPFGMVMISQDGQFEYVNPKFSEMFGYSPEELPDGKTWFAKAYPDPDYRNQVIDAWVNDLRQAETGEQRPRVFTVTCRDGSLKEVMFRPVQLETGDHLMTCEDITEAGRAERALKDSEERYRSIIENIEEGYYEVDLDGNMVFCNDALCRILGYERERLIGMNFREYMTEETAADVFLTFNKVFETGVPERCSQWELIRRDEARVIVENSVSLIVESSGRATGFRGICTDVTDRKKREQLYIENVKYRAVSGLAAGVAHNFNNLLQIVMGNANLALMNLDENRFADVKANMEQIIAGSRFGAETVRRLNSFARLPNGDVESDGKVFDLTDVVQQATEMTKPWWKTRAEKMGARIYVKTDLEMGCVVRGRKGDLFEVVVNLIKNAADAMPQGGEILLKCGIAAGRVELRVEDTGVGISEDDVGRAFTPFFTTKAEGGAGLGLAVSRTIVDNHGGKIFLESVQGKGTVVTVDLPLAAPPRVEVDEPHTELPADRLTVLVVDDIPGVVDMLSLGLEKYGHTALKASSGIEALKILKKAPVDAVVCDLGMPGMSGLQLGRALKESSERKGETKIPFILLTGWADQLEQVEARAAAGVDAVVEKPVSVKTLLALLGGLLEEP